MRYETPQMVELGDVTELTQGATSAQPCTEPGTNFLQCARSFFCLQNPNNPNC